MDLETWRKAGRRSCQISQETLVTNREEYIQALLTYNKNCNHCFIFHYVCPDGQLSMYVYRRLLELGYEPWVAYSDGCIYLLHHPPTTDTPIIFIPAAATDDEREMMINAKVERGMTGEAFEAEQQRKKECMIM